MAMSPVSAFYRQVSTVLSFHDDEPRYLEQINKRSPGFRDPVANSGRCATVLGGAHHPLLLLTCTFFLGGLGLGDIFGGRDLAHGLDEIGSLSVGDGECERSVV